MWRRLGGSVSLALALAGGGCLQDAPRSERGTLAVRVEVAPGQFVDALPDGAGVVVPRHGRLRGTLLDRGGAGTRAVLATLRGPRGARRDLAVPPGGPLAVDLELPAGAWRLEAQPGVVLVEGRGVAAQGHGRRVVLVTVDALRDDSLSAESTPQILAALSGARRFADTRAEATWTLPSMASLFTGQPALSLTAPDGTLIGPPNGVATLPELYQAAGFATAAFVANSTLRDGNGFGRGFARFETPALAGANKVDVAALVDSATAWLAAHRGEDCFVLLHPMETHEPLRDHGGRGRQVVSNQVLAARERPATQEEGETFRQLYALEVAHLDAPLATFFAALPADSVIALTADHGEMLGEGGSWGHGMTVFDPVARVPLLVRAAGIAPGVDPRPASLLDIAPTLLGRSGIATPERLAGFDLAGPIPADRQRTSSSFSAGPLRWSWVRQGQAGLAHFVAQPGIGALGAVTLLERQPLPAGVWQCAPACDGLEEHQSPAAGPFLAELATAFAGEVGQLVPGIQLLALDQPGGEPLRLEVADAEVSAAFATAPTVVGRNGSRLEIRWPEHQALALVVLPLAARPSPVGPGWLRGRNAPPAIPGPGLFLWRNPRRPAIQRAQAEILEHLRALGYIQ